MKTFYTITNAHTTHTNDRSQRFETREDAIRAATSRLQSGSARGVVILQAVEFIELAAPLITRTVISSAE